MDFLTRGTVMEESSMNSKVIFLDIDGVLNSADTVSDWEKKTGTSGYGGFFEETDEITNGDVKWGEGLVRNLKYIVKKTGADIVISSTWRHYFSVDKFKEMFAIYDWHNAPVIDRTPYGGKIRGLEVNTWLNKHAQYTNYVILDDSDDFMVSQIKNFVQTNPEVGLTKEDANKAIEILNKES